MNTIRYCCATYNVSTVSDFCLRLDRYSAQVSSPHAFQILKKSPDSRSAADHYKLQQIALDIYAQLSPSLFLPQLGAFGQLPDVICLQELYRQDPEKQPLIACIEQQGYQICGQKDTAIAFVRSRFSLIREKQLESSFFIDLKDRLQPLAIRVVSDHLAGFNAQTQKRATARIKEWARAPEDRTIQSDRELKKWGPWQGDQDLIQNLSALAQENIHPPELIIYGLDANATGAYVSKGSRLHPKRLAPFKQNGFVSDETDCSPTIIDFNDEVPRRYDYLFAKTLKGSLKLTSRTPFYALDNPELTFSDHLPTASLLELTV